MDQQPKVSVIMPSLNVAPYIRECIESVVNQTLKDIEIICVDAGSTDGTLEVLEEYAAKDERVKLLHSDKKSYGYQMNMGMDAATGEYMGIVETDDYIIPEMYEELYTLARDHDVDVCKGDFCRFYGDVRERSFEYVKISEIGLYNEIINAEKYPQLLTCYVLNQPGIYKLAFLRANNIRLNETPGASYQDNGLSFQILTQAEKIIFIPKAFYFLRRDNPNSSVKSTGKVFCFCEEFDFIRDFLREKPNLEKPFAPYCAYLRAIGYNATLKRISNEYKLAFIRRYADDFKLIIANGEFDESIFSKWQLNRIKKIVENPDLYYYQNIYEPTYTPDETGKYADYSKDAYINEIRKLKSELLCTRASFSFRLGRFLTFIPRKIRGAWECYKDHGIKYTLVEICKAIRGVKK